MPTLGRSLRRFRSLLEEIRATLKDIGTTLEVLHGFPGNIRDLENLLQVAAATVSGPTIGVTVLEQFLPTMSERAEGAASNGFHPQEAERKLELLQMEIEALRATSITARPIWQGSRFSTLHDYCFVLMPFSDDHELQAVYRDQVKAVVERCGLRCERADDIYDVRGVMQSVWEGINRARLVVADLTDRNPNVFYELGIAHTLGKPVIMISQSIEFVPFDLRHLRFIVYTCTPRGAAKLEQALERTIRTLLSSAVDLTADGGQQ